MTWALERAGNRPAVAAAELHKPAGSRAQTGNTIAGEQFERRKKSDLNAAAQAIGISADQLHQELAGKSLAEVAQAHGKTANDVATALKNAANQRIDQAVSAGRINATDAAQRKQDIATRIDQMVNQVRAQPGAPRGEPVAPPA